MWTTSKKERKNIFIFGPILICFIRFFMNIPACVFQSYFRYLRFSSYNGPNGATPQFKNCWSDLNFFIGFLMKSLPAF